MGSKASTSSKQGGRVGDVGTSPDFFSRGVGFLRGSVDELKKVSTPTRQETVQATIVTMLIMFFVAICLFLLDFLFGNLMESILGS